jgi:hypothetical protein
MTHEHSKANIPRGQNMLQDELYPSTVHATILTHLDSCRNLWSNLPASTLPLLVSNS